MSGLTYLSGVILYLSAGPNCIEDDLTRRLHFGARIITLNDHDARRDVNGFFFADDCSLTVYEYRQFGTNYVGNVFIQMTRFT